MLELFFDLVFAVAVAELGEALLHDISAAGFAHFAVLFVPLWWAWVGYAFYADRFDTDDVVLRAAMLTAMLGVIWLAIEISSAFHSPAGAAYFAAAYATVRLVLVGLYLRADYHEPRARLLTRRYIAGFSLGAVPWIISVWRSPQLGRGRGRCGDIGLGAVGGHPDRADAEGMRLPELGDGADARQQQRGQHRPLDVAGGGLDPLPVGAAARTVGQAAAGQAVAMRDLELVGPGGVEGGGDTADLHRSDPGGRTGHRSASHGRLLAAVSVPRGGAVGQPTAPAVHRDGSLFS
jgi:Bacterial low temperature requirement A protein (LtrA)